jgi:uncharacterized transporter YbjL
VVERIVRGGIDVESSRPTILEAGDDIVLAGPAAALIKADHSIGVEIEGAEVLREVMGDTLGVLVNNRALHGRTLSEIADQVGDAARGVFLRDLTRGREQVPLTPQTTIYLGDIMTLVGATRDVERAATKVGQVLRYGDRTDVAFLAVGIADGLAQCEGRIFRADAGRRRRCLARRADLRLAARAPADRRKLPPGRSTSVE